MPRIYFHLAIIFILLVSGCTGEPMSPAELDPDSDTTVPHQTESTGFHHCLGYSLLHIDTSTGGIEVQPLRSADLHINLVSILNMTMGVSASGVPALHDPLNGLFVFDITLTHPFATKPQFAGFDVKGILLAPGTLNIGPLVLSDVDETRLENADGYTRWWNPAEFTSSGMFGYTQGILATAPGSSLTATVNPYKSFADRLELSDSLAWLVTEPLDSDLGRAVFKAGESNTRRYEIRFPMAPGPQITYGYAIDASWDTPSPNPPGEVPDDFQINANQEEAYRVTFQETLNTLYYDSESGTSGGTVRFQVNIHDWQGQDASDVGNEIDGVRMFSPELWSGGIDGVYLNETATKARYTADLTGPGAPAAAGEALVMCRIGATGAGTYQQTGLPAPTDPVSAFQVHVVDVPDPECIGDTNNEFNEYIDLTIDEIHTDQLCAPTDYRDFYRLQIPYGNDVSGALILNCDVEPTKFGLYDESEVLITEENVSGGYAVIDINSLGLMPGTYYLRVLTQSSGVAFRYAIEPWIEVTDITPGNAVDITPDDLYLNPYCVMEDNGLLYAAGPYGLWVYDYESSTLPQFLDYTRIQPFNSPVVCNGNVYNTRKISPDDYRIDYVDASDPTNLVFHDSVIMPANPVSNAQVDSNYLYLVTFTNPDYSLDIYDISTDPSNPEYVNSTALTHDAWCVELVYDDSGNTWLLIGSYLDEKFYFYNITDVNSVTGGHTVSFGSSASFYDVVTEGKYVYVIYNTSNYLTVLEKTAIGTIFHETETLASTPSLIAKTGDYIIIKNQSDTMSVVDVSNPSAIPDESTWAIHPYYVLDICVVDDVCVMAAGYAGLQGFDVSTPTAPTYSGRKYGVAPIFDMLTLDDSMFVLQNYSPYHSVKTVDISDPYNAHVTGELLLESSLSDIAVCGDRMVVSEDCGFVQMIDATNHDFLTLLNSHDTTSSVESLGLTQYALYTGHLDGAVKIYSLSSWPIIVFNNEINLSIWARQIEIVGNYMYIRDYNDILVYSIVNPMSPSYVMTYTPQAAPGKFVVDGDIMYVPTAGTVEFVDVSSPQSPTMINSVAVPDAPNGKGVVADGQFIIANPTLFKPPSVIRVWPPDNPVAIGDLYPDTEYCYALSSIWHNDFYYEDVGDIGLRIWDIY